MLGVVGANAAEVVVAEAVATVTVVAEAEAEGEAMAAESVIAEAAVAVLAAAAAAGVWRPSSEWEVGLPYQANRMTLHRACNTYWLEDGLKPI